jgi:transcriptional regulator with PAS, ATPase and Fis domain
MKPFDEKYLLEAGRVAVARKEMNERSSGAIGEECFKAWTGTDRGVSIAVSNQAEIVISSPPSGSEKAATGEIIGQSRAVQQIIKQIEMVAPTDATVLILGETGTGKELIARELHRRSRRNKKPLVRVNCASIPNELYESEFFGHAKEHLPARSKIGLAASKLPPGERCSWTRLARSHWHVRANC